MAETKRNKIRNELRQQLEDMGVVGLYFYDLVDDYMELWSIKNKLIEDVKKRGVSVKYNNGGGQSGYKKNESIGELHKTNTQMLKILAQLEINVRDLPVDEDEDEEF